MCVPFVRVQLGVIYEVTASRVSASVFLLGLGQTAFRTALTSIIHVTVEVT